MNAKQIGVGLVLADFAALNAYVVYRYGYLGFYELALANAATVTLFVDLVIALGLVSLWMWRDARARGRSFWAYAPLTLLFGSVGPLLYLVRRLGDERPLAATPAIRAQARVAG
jgi:hypothetical protein